MSHDKAEIAKVQSIFETDLSREDLETFRDDAHRITVEVLGDEGYAADYLTMIERYLTCGLVELRDPRIDKASGAGTSVTYQQDSYLARAIGMDHTGRLRDYFADDEGGDKYTGAWAVKAGPQ